MGKNEIGHYGSLLQWFSTPLASIYLLVLDRFQFALRKALSLVIDRDMTWCDIYRAMTDLHT